MAIKREHVAKGRQLYARAIECYLAEKIVERLESLSTPADFLDALAQMPAGRPGRAERDWWDLGGVYVPLEQIRQLAAKITAQEIRSVPELHSAMQALGREADEQRWRWILQTWLEKLGQAPGGITVQDLVATVRGWQTQVSFFGQAALEDGQRDLATSAMWDGDRGLFRESAAVPQSLVTPTTGESVTDALQRELCAVDARAEALLARLSPPNPPSNAEV